MKTLIILISLMLFGCDLYSDKDITGKSFCINTRKYLISYCYAGRCKLLWIDIANQIREQYFDPEDVRVLMTQADKECP